MTLPLDASPVRRFPGGLVAIFVTMAPDATLAGHRHDTPTVAAVVAGDILDIRHTQHRVRPAGACWAVAAHEVRDIVAGASGARILVIAAIPGQPVATHPRIRNGGPLGNSPSVIAQMAALVQHGAADDRLEGLLLDWVVGLDGGNPRIAPWIHALRAQLDASAPHFLTTRALAATAGTHPESVARAFRRAFGISVREYVRRSRLVRARDLLAGSTLSLTQTAAAAGFADQSHLTREFTSRFGIPPGQYRQRATGSVPRVQDERFPAVHLGAGHSGSVP